jgi:hypothetical protein
MFTDYAWGQFALLGWVSACFFAAGARGKGIAFTRKTWIEIAQAAAIVVLLFAWMSEGRGCVQMPPDTGAFCVGDALC